MEQHRGKEKSLNKNDEWLKELKAEQNKTKQGNMQITDKENCQMEVSRTEWSSGLLAEKFASIT